MVEGWYFFLKVCHSSLAFLIFQCSPIHKLRIYLHLSHTLKANDRVHVMLVLFHDSFFLNLKLFTVRFVLSKYVTDSATHFECSAKGTIYFKRIDLSSIVKKLWHVCERAKKVNHGIDTFKGGSLVVIDRLIKILYLSWVLQHLIQD